MNDELADVQPSQVSIHEFPVYLQVLACAVDLIGQVISIAVVKCEFIFRRM